MLSLRKIGFFLCLLCGLCNLSAIAGSLEDTNPFDFYADEKLDRFFYNGREPLAVNASQFKSGLLKLEYSLDDSNYAPYVTPLKITEEGRHVLQYRVLDSMDQVVYTKLISFFVDTNAPNTRVVEGEGTLKRGNVYYLSNAKGLELTSYDSLSGVDYLEYSHDGKNWETYFQKGHKSHYSMDFVKEGKNTVYFRAVDNVGNYEKPEALTYVLSTATPASHLAVSPEAVQKGEDFYMGVAHTITLEPRPVQIPIAKIIVNLDGNEFVYTKPFRIPLPGKHKLSYYAIDEAGNKEPVNHQDFYTDDTAPQTAFEYNGNVIDYSEMILAGSDFSLSLSATDREGADLKEINYSFGAGRTPASTKTYDEPIKLKSDGLHHLNVRAVDKVGNRERDRVFAILSDLTPPRTHFKPLIALKAVGGKSYSTYPNAVVLEAADNISGVKSVQYALNGDSFEEYVGPIKLPHAEQTELKFRAIDALGNAEKEQSVSIYMISADLNIQTVGGKKPVVERAVTSEEEATEQKTQD